MTTVTVAPHNLKRMGRNSIDPTSMDVATKAINDRNVAHAFNYRQKSAKRSRRVRDDKNGLLPSTYNLTMPDQQKGARDVSPQGPVLKKPLTGASTPNHYDNRAASARHHNNKRILVQAIAKSFGILHAYGEYSNFMKVSKRFLHEKGLI